MAFADLSKNATSPVRFAMHGTSFFAETGALSDLVSKAMTPVKGKAFEVTAPNPFRHHHHHHLYSLSVSRKQNKGETIFCSLDQVVQPSVNPFANEKHAESVHTGVLMVNLYASDMSQVRVEHASSPVKLQWPVEGMWARPCQRNTPQSCFISDYGKRSESRHLPLVHRPRETPSTLADVLLIHLNVSDSKTFSVSLNVTDSPSGNLSCLLSIGIDEDPPMKAINACLDGAANVSCPRFQLPSEWNNIGVEETRIESEVNVTIIQSGNSSVTIFGEADMLYLAQIFVRLRRRDSGRARKPELPEIRFAG
jgi:hypothetical protein